MTKITTYNKTIHSANILSVSAGTNCPKGGDSGAGGRTIFRLKDDGATDIRVRLDDGEENDVKSIEIVLGGDTEAETFLKSLEFAVETLKSQMELNIKECSEEEVK